MVPGADDCAVTGWAEFYCVVVASEGFSFCVGCYDDVGGTGDDLTLVLPVVCTYSVCAMNCYWSWSVS